MRITTITAGLIGLTMLSACEEPEVILPGERFGTREILQDGETETVAVNTARAIALPASVNNANWAPQSAQKLRTQLDDEAKVLGVPCNH